MVVVNEAVIQKNTGRAFVVKKSQVIRITGESTADFVVFNLHNVMERFDQARTKVDLGKIYVSTGDVLISKFNNVMMTITKDTYQGTHDMEKGMCSTSFYKKWGDKIYGSQSDGSVKYVEIEDSGGIWRPVFDAARNWAGYRLTRTGVLVQRRRRSVP